MKGKRKPMPLEAAARAWQALPARARRELLRDLDRDNSQPTQAEYYRACRKGMSPSDFLYQSYSRFISQENTKRKMWLAIADIVRSAQQEPKGGQ